MHNEKRSKQDSSCTGTDCVSGKRNRYFRGKILRAEEFEIEQTYALERRRQINRSVIGWGVVQGFPISPHQHDHEGSELRVEPGPIHVGRGFALDRQGREVALTTSAKLGARNTFLVAHDGGGCRMLPLDHLTPGRYVLAIHYAERPLGDANLADACGCPQPEKNYVCETAVFSLRRLCDKECPCGESPCERSCHCGRCDSCGSRSPRTGDWRGT